MGEVIVITSGKGGVGKTTTTANLGSALADRHLARWTPETQQTATYHRMSNSSGSNQNNFKSSSMYLYDASYLRLKNLEVNYAFPKEWVKRMNITSCQLYVNGNNLFTISSTDDRRDPETSSSTVYPIVRRYNVGVRLSF